MFCKLQFTSCGLVKQNLHEFYSLVCPCKSPVNRNIQSNFQRWHFKEPGKTCKLLQRHLHTIPTSVTNF